MTTERETNNNNSNQASSTSDIVSDIESNSDSDRSGGVQLQQQQQQQQQQEHSTTTTTTKSSSTRQDLIDVLALKVVKQFTLKAEQPLIDTINNKILPKNSESVRKLPFYNTTLNAIKYQRDNYLVGQTYANNRNSSKNSYSYHSILNTRMPLDSTCMGHKQIVQLGSWFVPSTTIKDALLPIVVALPTNTLYRPIVDIVSNAIPLGQPLLDSAVKYSLIQFLHDPKWRYVIKTQTKGYIGHDDPNNETRK